MKITETTVLIAISILIILLLTCHISKFLAGNANTNSNKNKNEFSDLARTPTQYNKIYYYGKPQHIPCDNHAQIPCSLCPGNNNESEYKLSDADMALIYLEAYKQAGRNALLRKLQESQNV